MAAFDEHCYSNVVCANSDTDNILISTMCYRNNKSIQFPPSYQVWNGTDCDKISKNVLLRRLKPFYQNFCYVSVFVAFTLGLLIGVFIPIIYLTTSNFNSISNDTKILNDRINPQQLRSIFINNSYSKTTIDPIVNYTTQNQNNFPNDTFPTVRFVESHPEPKIDNVEDKMIMASDSSSSNFDTTELLNLIESDEFNRDIIENGIYWGTQVENSLPKGYGKLNNDHWNKFVKNSIAVRLENGCGRMQNRLVTFKDGSQACVRYRQNTDQIQGELFSFYLAQILHLPNVAPSTISIVDLTDPLWQTISTEISSAQWNSNRPVVLTKFIKNLDSAHIPNAFKPLDRHLNKFDVRNMTVGGKNFTLDADSKIMKELVELAQWSDLIIFDYLTANLDRIVNNLYNYQWNVNIMDAPAHNLARKIDSNLLVFLDNESGLLHGYRLLKKYEIYHTLLLDNLCVFRKSTADIIKQLKNSENVGQLLKDMFEQQNSIKVKDVLPTLPDKSIKILNERIDRVYNQISKCESTYSDRRKT